jgi:hypothetical protein
MDLNLGNENTSMVIAWHIEIRKAVLATLGRESDVEPGWSSLPYSHWATGRSAAISAAIFVSLGTAAIRRGLSAVT